MLTSILRLGSRYAAPACFIFLLLVVGENAITGQSLALPQPVPSMPGPPSPAYAQTLSPIPKQFEWMRREVRPNPRLEALLGLQEGPPQLFVTLSLSEEFSDNFFLTESDRQPGYQTSIGLGTVYRLEEGT